MNPSSAPEKNEAAPAAEVKAPVGQNEQVVGLLDLIADESDKKALVKQELNRLTYNNNWRLAQVFAKAGYFDSNGYNTPPMNEYQAMAKIEVGESWQLNPADSIRFVYIIGGKPAIEEAVFAARLFSAGWSWDIQWIGGQGASCKGVRLFAEKNGIAVMKPIRDEATGQPYRDKNGEIILQQAFAEFTEEQAAGIKIWQNKGQVSLLQKAGPWSDGRRSNMYYWRAVSQFRRWFAPNVIAGALIRDEADDIKLENMAVYSGEPRRTGVMGEASESLKASVDPAPPPPTSPPPPPPPPTPPPHETPKETPKNGKSEKNEGISQASFAKLAALEKTFGVEKFDQIIQQMMFATFGDIKTEADAKAVIIAMEMRR